MMCRVAVVSSFMALSLSSWVSAMMLDDSKVIPVSIAQEGLTRLSVKGDKIVHIFTSPAEAGAHVVHHESGHVFIAPSGFDRSISLTLVTGEGQTQDLTLTPKPGIKARPLIFEREKPPVSKPKRASLQEQAGEILKVFVAGGIAPGFKEIPAFEGEKRQLLEMKFCEIRRFETGSFRVSVLEGVNQTDHLQTIRPVALTDTRDLALYVVSPDLKPEARGRIFIVQQK